MKNIHDDLSSLDLGIHKAMRSGTKSASLETDVFVVCTALRTRSGACYYWILESV